MLIMQSLLESKCCCPFTSFPPIVTAHLQKRNYSAPPHDPPCSLALTPHHRPSSPSISGASPRSIVAIAAVIGSSHHHQEPWKNPVGRGSKPWVHFIGIGGAGLSALAFFALKQGWKVSGSDISWSPKLEDLQKAGAIVYIGHRGSQIQGDDGKLPDHVVLSSAIPCTNEELILAQELNILIHKRGSWLARLTSNYDLIAISGTHGADLVAILDVNKSKISMGMEDLESLLCHEENNLGKSTTTAMVSMVLKEMGNDISALVGANVSQFPGGGGVLYGNGKLFVVEADEYDGCFLNLSPYVALITNIEWEHVDKFPNEEAVVNCFRKFAMCIRAGGTMIFCGDNAAARSVANNMMGERSTPKDGLSSIKKTTRLNQLVSYGLRNGNMWQAVMLETNAAGGTNYFVTYNGEVITKVELKLPGVHNVLNSLAAIVTSAVLSAETPSINDAKPSNKAQREAAKAASRSLKAFVGVQGRFELIGVGRGFQLFDDYAHHPTEILAVVEATRQKFPNQPLWLVFQPHTYSRLVKLLDDFAFALSKADHIIITEVFSARETNAWEVSGQDLVNRIHGPPAVYIPQMNDICTYIKTKLAMVLQDEVIVFTLGAGDIRSVGLKLMQSLCNGVC